jgi:putative hydrolase of HD superfamily
VAFEPEIVALTREYRERRTPEARLAHDADQIALILELKELDGIGYATPKDWLPHVRARLLTATGQALADAVGAARREDWWWEAAASREPSPGNRA